MKHFANQMNVAVLHIASKLFPLGYAIQLGAPGEPTSHPEITEGQRLCIRFPATYSGLRLFEAKEVYCAFEAWHAQCHNRSPVAATELEAERRALQHHCADLRAIYGTGQFFMFCYDRLHAYIIGREYYKQMYGLYPRNAAKFVEHYVRNPAVAIMQDPHAYHEV